MIYKFTASITKEGKWYVARAVELGVVSQGKTIDEARMNLEEAVELFLEKEPSIKKQISRKAPLLTTLEARA